MKKTFALLLCAILLLGCLPLSALAATIITRVELTLTLPVAGKTPATNCAIHGNGYTIHAIDWEEIGGRGFLEDGETFREGYTYEATIWVEAFTGYEFSYMDSKTPAITGYINGKEVEVGKAYEYNAWAMVCMTVRFNNIPSKGWIKHVELTVPSPSAGASPSYTRITGTGYGTANVYFGDSTNENMQNGIAWYAGKNGDYLTPGQDTFGENTAYTFHCLVFPEDGYKITEDATVYVNGKDAEAKLDYDTFLAVTYTFPKTGKVPPTHTHTPSDWRTTGIYHYTVCTTCGEFLEQEDHKGGEATCTEKAKCEVCGVSYGQYEPDHTWSPTYLYKDKTGHAWICAVCKENSPIEKHNPGPAATETTPQTCKDCGYIIAPAKSHTHDLTLMPYVAPTCLATGTVEHYTCSGCTTLFSDAEGKQPLPENTSVIIPYLTHETSDNWGIDDQFHWRSCKLCGTVLEETKMVHQVQDGKCATCGYAPESDLLDTPDTPDTAPDKPAAPADGGSWKILALVALVCFGAAITTTVIILKKKKKGE